MNTRIPTITSITRPTSGLTAGDQYFETDTKSFIIWDGTNWRGYNSDSISYLRSESTHSIDLDGNDDIIQIDSIASTLAGTSNFTISAWIRIASTSDGGSILWASRNNDFSYRVYLAVISGRPYAQIQKGAGVNYDIYPANTVSANTWTHLCMVLSSNTLELFVDNSSVGSISAATTDSSIALSTIGARGYNSSGNVDLYLDGQLDDVAVFDYALNSGQRSALYNNKIYTAPKALWLFDNDVTDLVGNHDGTASGSPAFLAKSDNSANTPY